MQHRSADDYTLSQHGCRAFFIFPPDLGGTSAINTSLLSVFNYYSLTTALILPGWLNSIHQSSGKFFHLS